MYTKEKFGNDLEKRLSNGFDVKGISTWAYEKYLSNGSGLDKNLSRVIMSIVAMDEGPEFEYTKEELLELARSLQENI